MVWCPTIIFPSHTHITLKISRPSFHLNIHTSFFLQEAGLNWILEDIWPINFKSFKTRECLLFQDGSFDFWQITYSAPWFCFLSFAQIGTPQIWFCLYKLILIFFLYNVLICDFGKRYVNVDFTIYGNWSWMRYGIIETKYTSAKYMLCRKTKKNILFVMSNRLNENISCAKKLAEFLTCEIVP